MLESEGEIKSVWCMNGRAVSEYDSKTDKLATIIRLVRKRGVQSLDLTRTEVKGDALEAVIELIQDMDPQRTLFVGLKDAGLEIATYRRIFSVLRKKRQSEGNNSKLAMTLELSQVSAVLCRAAIHSAV
jgi:DNA-binding MurR/RpiR family transcriptional regulator